MVIFEMLEQKGYTLNPEKNYHTKTFENVYINNVLTTGKINVDVNGFFKGMYLDQESKEWHSLFNFHSPIRLMNSINVAESILFYETNLKEIIATKDFLLRNNFIERTDGLFEKCIYGNPNEDLYFYLDVSLNNRYVELTVTKNSENLHTTKIPRDNAITHNDLKNILFKCFVLTQEKHEQVLDITIEEINKMIKVLESVNKKNLSEQLNTWKNEEFRKNQ